MLSANTFKQAACLAGLTTLAGWGGGYLPSAQAATFILDTWSTVGDALIQENNVFMSNNRLAGEDVGSVFTLPDEQLNFSGELAVDSYTLESTLSLSSKSLDQPDNDAYEGSAVYTEIVLTESTTFSFDWLFLTNETFFEPQFPDYAFVSINQSVIVLANAFEPLAAFPAPPLSFYQFQRGGFFSQTLEAGTYQIAIGVIDVGDFVVSSGLAIVNAKFDPPIIVDSEEDDNGDGGDEDNGPMVTVPESSGILSYGLISTVGVVAGLMRRLGRKS